MRFSVNVPNFGDFADPRAVATVATAVLRHQPGVHGGHGTQASEVSAFSPSSDSPM
jgi:hypothetical protein